MIKAESRGDRPPMLQPGDALQRVLDSAAPGAPKSVPLAEACFLVSAQDVIAPESFPFFSSSAMDGYAVHSADLQGASPGKPVTLPLAGEIRAEAGRELTLERGETVKIMTGGAFPGGADAVVKREDVAESGEAITFFHVPDPGSFINRQGEEIAAGTVLWPAGRQINPASLGLFASLGLDRVTVFPAPSVSLIATGDELVRPGSPRKGGQVFDSVSPMLTACLQKAGARVCRARTCTDRLDMLSGAVQASVAESEITVTVGGVSLGDYDLVLECMERLGVERLFWKVAQKPGKPLFFGRLGHKLVFGLPGNPASALVCCLLYVLPALRRIMGFTRPGPPWLQGHLADGVSNMESRTWYARGSYAPHDGGYRLDLAGLQSSYMLASFAQANAVVEIPPGPVSLAAGQKVSFTPLD